MFASSKALAVGVCVGVKTGDERNDDGVDMLELDGDILIADSPLPCCCGAGVDGNGIVSPLPECWVLLSLLLLKCVIIVAWLVRV